LAFGGKSYSGNQVFGDICFGDVTYSAGENGGLDKFLIVFDGADDDSRDMGLFLEDSGEFDTVEHWHSDV
jgi:hypothetical protein